MAKTNLLRCPQVEESARKCELSSFFLQRTQKSRTGCRSGADSNPRFGSFGPKTANLCHFPLSDRSRWNEGVKTLAKAGWLRYDLAVGSPRLEASQRV